MLISLKIALDEIRVGNGGSMRFFFFLLGCFLFIIGATTALSTTDYRGISIGGGIFLVGFVIIWLSLRRPT
jgi:hypothetical protein